MNYWKLENKSQQSFLNKIDQTMFKLINIQSQQRNKLDFFLILFNYLLSYGIIFFLIMQSLACQFVNAKQRVPFESPQQTGYPHLARQQTTTHDYKVIMILMLVRMGLAGVYVLLQRVVILCCVKILLIVSIFMSEFESNHEEFIAIEVPLIIVELLALAVWTYKIERRIVHFDSRLNARIPFLKDSLIFVTVFFIKRVQKMSFNVTIIGEWMGSLNFTIYEIQALQLIITCLVCVLFLDYADVLYNRTFKSLLLSLDVSFIALIVSWAFSVHVTGKKVAYFNYIMLLGTLIGLQLVVLFRKEQCKELYEIQSRKVQFQSENRLLKYFETMRRLIKSQNISPVQKNIAIIRFILYHRSACLFPACPFTKRYNMQDSVELKCQLIEQYMLKSLQKLSKTRPLLKKYLIFYLSPKDKIFRYIDQQESYMKRQLQRIKQVKKQLNNQIRILQAEVTKKVVNQLIKAYLTYGKRFFEILMKQNVSCGNLIGYGQKMLDFLDKVQDLKTNSTNFTQGVRVLINNFSTQLINDSKTDILETVVDPPFLIHRTTQSGPTFIVSAESQKFLRIIDANIACTKEFYYPKQVFLSVTVIDLLPDQIKVKHREHFDRVSKKTDFNGQKDFPTSLFVTNKNGFMTFFVAVIYLLNSIKGRMWCIALEITHKIDAIMLVAMEKNGVVMGISEMAVYHGLKTTDKGKELKESFYRKMTAKIEGTNKYKSVIVEPYEKIFENSDLQFFETKSFEVVEKFTAFEFSYFLVQIRSVQGSQISGKGRGSILRSLIQIDNRPSSASISEQELNFVPKFQFFYHSDGVVRTYGQKSQKVLKKFDSLISKGESEEEQMKDELGQGITEMRLIDEQLDFLQNIEVENEFMSKPRTQIQRKQNELKRFQMKIQFFEQCYEQRKQMVSKWLKYTRGYFIVITI